MVNSNQKGSRRERELVNRIRGDGHFAMRAATSGSATEFPLPDVLAIVSYEHMHTPLIRLVEVKGTSNGYVNLDREKIDDLRTLEALTGTKAWVGVVTDRKGWEFYHLDDLNETETGGSVKQDQHGWGYGYLLGSPGTDEDD